MNGTKKSCKVNKFKRKPESILLETKSDLMCRGRQVCRFQWSHLCLRNSLKIATRICQFSQYLGTKLDMLFEIAKSVEIIIILGKPAILP